MRNTLKTSASLAGAAIGLALLATPALAATVASTAGSPTTIGAVIAGQHYTATATGTSDLFDAFNGGAGLTFTADGIPTYTFPNPYTGFNPNGLSFDPSTSAQRPCVGGAPTLCGALIGGFTATPGATPTSYFQIGSSYSFTAPVTGFLVGLVNDVDGGYGDNGPEGFQATLAAAALPGAVPEPASWALMIGGFGLAGAGLRRRRRGAISVA